MNSNAHNHVIEIDEDQRTLTIFRLGTGGRQPYTSIKLPEKNWAEDSVEMKEFRRLLGESIILDSPQARRLLQI